MNKETHLKTYLKTSNQGVSIHSDMNKNCNIFLDRHQIKHLISKSFLNHTTKLTTITKRREIQLKMALFKIMKMSITILKRI
jgi:hypothetical protein